VPDPSRVLEIARLHRERLASFRALRIQTPDLVERVERLVWRPPMLNSRQVEQPRGAAGLRHRDERPSDGGEGRIPLAGAPREIQQDLEGACAKINRQVVGEKRLCRGPRRFGEPCRHQSLTALNALARRDWRSAETSIGENPELLASGLCLS